MNPWAIVGLIGVALFVGLALGALLTAWLRKPKYCARCRGLFAIEDELIERARRQSALEVPPAEKEKLAQKRADLEKIRQATGVGPPKK